MWLPIKASVAQWVERLTGNQRFVGFQALNTRSTFFLTCILSCIWTGDGYQNWTTSLVLIVSDLPKCRDPGRPKDGQRAGDEFFSGSVVKYSCNPGCFLHGSAIRICRPDGRWSGTQPICKQIIQKLWLDNKVMIHCSAEIWTFVDLLFRPS